MSSGEQRVYSLESRGLFVSSLLLAFCILFGVAGIVGYVSYRNATDATIRSNRTSATLVAKLIQEHQRAAVGILQSYARQPLLIDVVKRKDFEGALKNLSDLAKNNLEVEWPYIANPDSTIWVNFPVDRKVFNRDLSARDWYKGVSKEWKPYISAVYKMVVGEKDLAVTISVPVLDEKGKVIGILNAAQSTALFHKVIDEVSSGTDVHMTLVDQEGHIISSNRLPYAKEVIDYPQLDLVGRAKKGEKGDIEIQGTSDGNEGKLVSFAPIGGAGWSIIVEKGKSEVFRSEYSYFALIAAISFLIFFFVVLSLVYLRARHRQIRSLEKLNEELDERVRERTSELKVKNQSLNGEITERKKVEEALQEGEERLRFALETSHTGAWDLDLVNHTAYRSLEHDRIFGHEQLLPQWTYEMFLDHVLPEDRGTVAGKFRQAVESQGDWNFECRIRRSDGEIRWIWAAGRHRSETGGRVRRMAGIVQDITERKHTEEALWRSENRLRRFYESGLLGVIYWNMRGEITDANAKFLEMAGYDREDLTAGRIDWVHMTPPEYRHRDEQSVEELKAAGVNKEPFEKEFIRKDGTRFPVIVAGTMLDDARFNGVAFVLDISKWKQAELDLRQSEQRFSDLYSSMTEGVAQHEVIYDKTGQPTDYTIRDVNPAFEAITGLSKDNIINKRASGIYGTDKAPYLDLYSRVASSRQPKSFETYFQPMKKHFHISVFSPAKGEFATVFQDISERKRAEERLHKSEARFKLLSDTSGRLLTTDNPQGIVNELCQGVMRHLDCQAFFNFLVDKDAGRLRLNTCSGIPEEEARKIEWLDFGAAVCGCVARDGARIVATDIFNTPDIRTNLVKTFGIQAYACHPLICQDQVIGTLSFGTRTRASFTSEELALMKTVADQVATAMERMRLIKELRRSHDELEKRVQERTEELAKSQERLQKLASQLLLAQEKERKRVAIELHDGLLSELAATKYMVEGRVMLLEKGKVPDIGDLKRISNILGAAIKEARGIMNNLHPTVLDELGLIAAINWLTGEYERSYPHIKVQKRLAVSEKDIEESVGIVIFRVLQEALNNFAKHGKGDLVELSLVKSDSTFAFTIQDNGQGFDVENAPKGLGLESMRERVELSGGEFQIESIIGQGTTIRAIWSI